MRKSVSTDLQMSILHPWLVVVVAAFTVLSVCMGIQAGETDIQRQALEAALKAGILTQSEYEAKKAKITGGAVREKLQALETARQAGILTDSEYERKKAALTMPVKTKTGTPRTGSVPAEGRGKLTADELAPAKTNGKIYRHPTGVSFWYPADWRLTELEGILQLVPPGAASAPESFESYFVTGERVAEEGITQANDPMVIDYLDEQMAMLGAQLGVVFQRQGSPKSVTTSTGEGQGIRLDWTAQSNIGPANAYAMASVIGGYGLVVAGVGVKGLAKKREPEVMRIFTSFGVGRGKNDPTLVGAWKLKGTYAAQNDSVWETAWSKAKVASETKCTLRFKSDGTWTRQDQSYMIVGAGDLWKESHDVSASEGRWNAEGGRLFMLWKDQSFADYQYRFEGGRLHLLAAGKGQAWDRAE